MGTRGQGVGDGNTPGHQPLHRSGNPTGGDTHHTRRESGDGQEVINGREKEQRKTVQLKVTLCVLQNDTDNIQEKVCCCSVVAHHYDTETYI